VTISSAVRPIGLILCQRAVEDLGRRSQELFTQVAGSKGYAVADGQAVAPELMWARAGPPRLDLRKGTALHSARRPRRYLDPQWLSLLMPVLRYSHFRDAFVLRGIGNSVGPVLRPDRRDRRQRTFDGTDRRGTARVA
jgi:hypothetical protein